MSNKAKAATARLKAFGVNCSLKSNPEKSSSQKLLDQLLRALRKHDVETSSKRTVDHDISKPA